MATDCRNLKRIEINIGNIYWHSLFLQFLRNRFFFSFFKSKLPPLLSTRLQCLIVGLNAVFQVFLTLTRLLSLLLSFQSVFLLCHPRLKYNFKEASPLSGRINFCFRKPVPALSSTELSTLDFCPFRDDVSFKCLLLSMLSFFRLLPLTSFLHSFVSVLNTRSR